MVDLYANDFGGYPPLDKIIAWPPCAAISLKAAEGTYYKPRWFKKQWPLVKQLAGDRYGKTFFRQAYTFLKFDLLGMTQADYFLQAIDEAGGWGDGDFPVSIDAEAGSEHNTNRKAGKQQIIDCISTCAERLKGATGRPVILYGIGILRDHRIIGRLGCDYLWAANYNAHLPASEYTSLGWKVSELFAWQYAGTPDGGKLAGYPLTVPGCGQKTLDMSALQIKDLPGLCAERV